MYVTSQKQVATWLPVKNKSKIWSIEMADECSFWAERHSMAIIRDVILVHTDCKEMDLCPIRVFFRRKAFRFWQTWPKIKSAVFSYFNLSKSVPFSIHIHYFKKNRSDRACTLYYVVCFMPVYAKFRAKILRRFLLLVVSCRPEMEWRHCASGYRRYSSGYISLLHNIDRL